MKLLSVSGPELLHALRYPLYPHSITVIVFGAFMLWLFSTSLFGLLLVVTVGTGVLQFLLLCLRHSALGDSEPPKITSNGFLRFGATIFKLLAVVLVGISLIRQVHDVSPPLSMALVLTGSLLLPAFVTLLALEDSAAYALHPKRLFGFAWRGGLPYLLLAALSGWLIAKGHNALAAVIDNADFATSLVFRIPHADAFAWLLAGLYLATAFANILGRIAHSAHDFHAPAGHSVEVSAPEETDTAAAIAVDLAAGLRRKDPDVIATWQRHAGRDHEFQGALLDTLLRERAWPLIALQAQRTIACKLKAHRQPEALKIAMQTMNDYASFTTETPEQWLQLCMIAKESGPESWLAALAKRAPEKFPQHPVLVDIALLQAQHVSRHENDPARALAILAPFIELHDHPRHAELKRVHAALRILCRS